MPLTGGKALALAALSRAGFRVPDFVCITTDAYNAFVDRTGLRERILLELNRKDFRDMRWEEVWDCATRIRNMFLRKPMPTDMESALRAGLEDRFGSAPVAVRSSATDEDGAAASFAGLHESYVHLRGVEAILEHIRMVWASLWSDAALLYRQELGLDVGRSAMAVVVQKMVLSDRSGVAFSQSPNDPSQAVVEAVYGLNQGLVDGAVAPDRWVVDRDFSRILSHTAAHRDQRFCATAKGVERLPLSREMAATPPLADDEVRAVVALSLKAEAHFGTPQDVEWTLRGDQLYLLQSRAVTTRPQAAEGDQRVWYLSLHRSLENLKALRVKIEQEAVPAMIQAAQELAAIDPATLSDRALSAEIRRRIEINTAWANVYWADFIPFAHAIRLFGKGVQRCRQAREPLRVRRPPDPDRHGQPGTKPPAGGSGRPGPGRPRGGGLPRAGRLQREAARAPPGAGGLHRSVRGSLLRGDGRHSMRRRHPPADPHPAADGLAAGGPAGGRAARGPGHSCATVFGRHARIPTPGGGGAARAGAGELSAPGRRQHPHRPDRGPAGGCRQRGPTAPRLRPDGRRRPGRAEGHAGGNGPRQPDAPRPGSENYPGRARQAAPAPRPAGRPGGGPGHRPRDPPALRTWRTFPTARSSSATPWTPT